MIGETCTTKVKKTPPILKPKDRAFLRKNESTMDQDDMLLPLWESPLEVTNRTGPSRWKVRADVGRDIEDQLKPEICSRKGRGAPFPKVCTVKATNLSIFHTAHWLIFASGQHNHGSHPCNAKE